MAVPESLVAPPAPPEPGARPTLWAVRAVVTVHLAAALAQPVLAGLYLTGDLDAIVAHAAVAGVVLLTDLVLLVVTVLHAVAGRGPWWLPGVVLGFVAAVITQIALGAARLLAGHIPLGVAIVSASVVLSLWAWGPGARHGRLPRVRTADGRAPDGSAPWDGAGRDRADRDRADRDRSARDRADRDRDGREIVGRGTS